MTTTGQSNNSLHTTSHSASYGEGRDNTILSADVWSRSTWIQSPINHQPSKTSSSSLWINATAKACVPSLNTWFDLIEIRFMHIHSASHIDWTSICIIPLIGVVGRKSLVSQLFGHWMRSCHNIFDEGVLQSFLSVSFRNIDAVYYDLNSRRLSTEYLRFAPTHQTE